MYVNTLQIVTQLARTCHAICSQMLFGVTADYSAFLRHMLQRGLYLYHPFINNKQTATIALFSYTNRSVHQCIWELKFKNKIHHAQVLGALLADALVDILSELEQLHNFADPILCTVPSHAQTLRERGYQVNHLIATAAIAAGLSDSVQYHKALLRKTTHVTRQSRIPGRTARLRNPLGAFAVSDTDAVVGRNIVLLDDVRTTGATIDECTKILLSAGARRVLRVTIAH